MQSRLTDRTLGLEPRRCGFDPCLCIHLDPRSRLDPKSKVPPSRAQGQISANTSWGCEVMASGRSCTACHSGSNPDRSTTYYVSDRRSTSESPRPIPRGCKYRGTTSQDWRHWMPAGFQTRRIGFDSLRSCHFIGVKCCGRIPASGAGGLGSTPSSPTTSMGCRAVWSASSVWN